MAGGAPAGQGIAAMTAPLNKAYWKTNKVTVKGVRLQGWSVRDIERLAKVSSSSVERLIVQFHALTTEERKQFLERVTKP
jgi:hypothetical protein